MGDARRLLRRLSEKAGASQTLSRPIDSEPPAQANVRGTIHAFHLRVKCLGFSVDRQGQLWFKNKSKPGVAAET